MSNHQDPETKPEGELTEEEQSEASGGAFDAFLNLGGIKGEG